MNTDNRSKYLTEGVVIAASTIVSYIIAFKYEQGFCSYWAIPTYLIEISLTSIIAAGMGLFSFLLLLFLIMDLPITLIHGELSKEDSLKKRIIIFHLIFFVLLVAILLGYGISLILLFLIFIVVVMDVICFLLPWWNDKKKNPDTATFSERIIRSDYGYNNSLFGLVRSLIGKNIYLTIFVVTPLVTFIASAAGSATAKNAQRYLVVESENLILIKKYGDIYILRPIDTANNKVNNQIVLWRSEDIAKYRLVPKLLNKIEIITN